MRHILKIAASGVIATVVFAAPASASYMQNCKKLIGEWEACQESSGSCESQQLAIENECKCHVQKGNDWKLVNAAVAKDDVCGHPPEDIILPPPPPPPPVLVREPPKKEADKEHEEKGDKRENNVGRQPN